MLSQRIAATLCLSAGLGIPVAAAAARVQTTFYVSPQGSDANPGTLAKPLRTLQAAQAAVRAINGRMTGDIVVYLRGGVYPITQPLVFDPRDSGTDGRVVLYSAYRDEKAVISGGEPLTGWKLYKGNIYEATLKRPNKLRQLYVNGKRAVMARGRLFAYSAAIQGYGKYTITGNEPWALSPGSEYSGFTFPKADLGLYKDPEDVELCTKAGFGFHTVSLRDIQDVGTKRVAMLQEPIGAIAQSVPQFGEAFISDLPKLDAVSELYFQNALELLHTPGQFYFDRPGQRLYYAKRADEDMNRATVIVPVSPQLLIIKGESTTHRVSNIGFKGITFAYNHYPLMKAGDSRGDTTIQSIAMFTKYVKGGDWGKVLYRNTSIQTAAIEVENADRIDFTRDVFEHLGGVGVSLGNDVNDSEIAGSTFRDIGSAAISVGTPKDVYADDGDFPPGVEGVPTGDAIRNNCVRNVAVSTLQAPAMTLFYSRGLDVAHNDVFDAPYTGISLGWGWTQFTRITRPHDYSKAAADNRIEYNRIDDVLQKMHDGGGIYILGEQPGSKVVGNYIGKVGGFSSGSAIYLDQGSRFLTVSHNYSTDPSGWFFVWGKPAEVYNIRASGDFSTVVHGNEGANLHDSPHFHNARVITAGRAAEDNSAGIVGPNAGECRRD